MIDKVRNTIIKYNMIPCSEKVIVALSGGSDSMALLHSLLRLKDEFNTVIEAAHVNHGIRGKSADRDEEFVKDVCSGLGIKLHLLKADVPSAAELYGMTVEQAGRKIRYDFFDSVCGDGVIATAHNLNDRIETFLFNFTRGSALRGLCSIPPVRDNIIRPIIDCSKEEIMRFCNENSILFVTDETNSDTDYARNRIRHNVIPELLRINSGFENNAFRCINSINEDEAFLNNQAISLYDSSKTDTGYSIETLNKAPSPLKKRAVRMILASVSGSDIDMQTVYAVCEAMKIYCDTGKGMSVQLPGGSFARTRAGVIEFLNISASPDIPDKLILKRGENRFGEFKINVSDFSDSVENTGKYPDNYSVFYGDCDVIEGAIFARTREPDDCIKFRQRGISKSLRKIQNENKIQPELRLISPVICDEKGILCAYGCGIDERFTVNTNTVNKVIIIIERILSC